MKAKQPRLPVSRLDDADMQAAPAAMERAVRRAHRVAHQHGTGVLVVENGKMVEIEPDPALYGDEQRSFSKGRLSPQSQLRTRR